jgi:hypothetical protein
MAKVTRKEVDTLAIFKAEMAKKSKVDDGAKGKSAEVALKNFINPNSKIKGYVTPQAKDFDIFVMENGKRANIEIKTACGELAIIDELSESITEMISSVYPKSTYIAYCPEVVDNIPMEQQFFMFSRDEFIAMCESYGGRGSIVRIKTPTNNTESSERGKYRLSFQSFRSNGRPKASAKIAEHIWDCCYNQPTVEQWIQEREG